MSRLEEINAILDEKYGEAWQIEEIEEQEAREWVEACYEHYEKDCELMETYGGIDTEETAFGYGKPFALVDHVTYDGCLDGIYDCTLRDLPMWIIEIDDQEVYAYPDEIFYD